MIINKILAFILSLITAGGPATGAVIGTIAGTVVRNVELPTLETPSIIQKHIINPQKDGLSIDLTLAFKN